MYADSRQFLVTLNKYANKYQSIICNSIGIYREKDALLELRPQLVSAKVSVFRPLCPKGEIVSVTSIISTLTKL